MDRKKYTKPTSLDKWRFSFIGGLIVIMVFNPISFSLMYKMFPNILLKVYPTWCPTWTGYVLHTIVYILLVRLSMEF